jgi:hypothetical protein
MGRRSVSSMSPKEIREQAAKHFRKLVSAAGTNLVQFRAQIHEEEMVELLVGFTRDISLSPTLRRQCALDVIQLARGPQAPWYHDGQTINPHAMGETGNTVQQEIEEARKTSNLFTKLDEMIRSNTHPSTWPEEVRIAAGEMLPSLEASWAAECMENGEEP